MPKNKDLKRLIRARMDETGESYTTARFHILAKDLPLPADYARVAGMSDDRVREATGRTWREWTRLLDGADAARLPHQDIAKWVAAQGASGWWSQMVTVAYERFRGLRDIGQRRDGGYEVGKSKTIAVPVAELWRAFEDPSRRALWMEGETLTIRTSREPRTMRARLSDGTPLDVYFAAKGDAKSTVTCQLRGLSDRHAAEAARKAWGRRLDTLKMVLTSR